MFLSIGMLKQKYFLTDIFILSAEKQPIKLSWRKIEWLLNAFLANIQEGRSLFCGDYELFRLGKFRKEHFEFKYSPVRSY
ncbi:hypothetical protein HMPREF9447_05501 [Bacteroides oleiciplenus YIT 12058]|uniref:Uncharacterized protein n=1 Tax=Bacteroides oleiciplenus YIT 12058 TaxID=742727 RepID=K9E904_9BACE|nr:hypothetical protein HMPREF9447_05501 [Bacteroides oleiciplenus YIT 12058]